MRFMPRTLQRATLLDVRALVAGAGIFGVTTALALRARGLDVTLVDPGPIPHPLAESTDISKVVRLDYGADEEYVALGERALAGWQRWNAAWPRPLFHATGVTFLARAAMAPGGFEHDSYELLRRRGHPLVRLDAAAIARRFPAYRPGALVDGYYNPVGGWAESGAVVAQLVRDAVAAGVVVRAAAVGVGAVAQAEQAGDLVVACAGAWVPLLVPELAGALRAVGQPVFHVQPEDAALFDAARFPVFGADISRTGYYGFPVNRGVVKIANHGVGRVVPPDATDPTVRAPSTGDEVALRAFLADTFPALAGAPITHRRLCVYCDTVDGDFWIARHPERPRLVVATGGSGHAFKFAPALGELIAAVALAEPTGFPALERRFGWRPERTARSAEAARFHPT
jgi:glycine/D-amino acid oxidase-like deaminating enzyme